MALAMRSGSVVSHLRESFIQESRFNKPDNEDHDKDADDKDTHTGKRANNEVTHESHHPQKLYQQ